MLFIWSIMKLKTIFLLKIVQEGWTIMGQSDTNQMSIFLKMSKFDENKTERSSLKNSMKYFYQHNLKSL